MLTISFILSPLLYSAVPLKHTSLLHRKLDITKYIGLDKTKFWALNCKYFLTHQF